VTYTDGRGARYEEHYSIDLAAQKEVLDLEDAEEMIFIKLAEHMERATRALDTISRTLDSPDRRVFMRPLAVGAHLNAQQSTLLAELIAQAAQTESQSFLVSQFVGHERATIRSLSQAPKGGGTPREMEACIEDVEYLCRAGALQGHYRHGSLWFSLAPSAERFVQNKTNLSAHVPAEDGSPHANPDHGNGM
jgi:hypothetical protein